MEVLRAMIYFPLGYAAIMECIKESVYMFIHSLGETVWAIAEINP